MVVKLTAQPRSDVRRNRVTVRDASPTRRAKRKAHDSTSEGAAMKADAYKRWRASASPDAQARKRAREAAYNARPEVQARKRARDAANHAPEAKVRKRAREATPAYTEVAAARRSTPAYKEAAAARRSTPAYKEVAAARRSTPAYKEAAQARRSTPICTGFS